MLVDLGLEGRGVVVVGSGEPARLRARMLAREGARVTRLPEPGPSTTRPKKAEGRRPRAGIPSLEPISRLRKIRPAIVFSTSRDDTFNAAVVRAGHSVGALVHVYDMPALSDFIMPSVGSTGGIHLAVSTSGRSPAMAAVLRRRLERQIRRVDVEQVRLLGRLRPMLRRSAPTFEARRAIVYRILRDREVRRQLRAGRFPKALSRAQKIAQSGGARGRRA